MPISSLGVPRTSLSAASGEALSAEAIPPPQAGQMTAFEVDADQSYLDGTMSELND
jgi:hypothetical protein